MNSRGCANSRPHVTPHLRFRNKPCGGTNEDLAPTEGRMESPCEVKTARVRAFKAGCVRTHGRAPARDSKSSCKLQAAHGSTNNTRTREREHQQHSNARVRVRLRRRQRTWLAARCSGFPNIRTHRLTARGSTAAETHGAADFTARAHAQGTQPNRGGRI